MNTGPIKWLNFILTIIALGAIYIFAGNAIDPGYHWILITALVIIGISSLTILFRKEGGGNRDKGR